MNKLNYEVDEFIYEKQINIDNDSFRNFANTAYNDLKEQHILSNIYTKLDIQNKIIYEPGSYLEHYNIFSYFSIELYELLKNIKILLQQACDEYQINLNEQQYMIHGWLNYLNVDNFYEDTMTNLPWHDHGKRQNAFHGYYCINAEPSVTHYKINEKYIDRENKNGRLILAKTGIPHAVGKWNYSEPRITIAYNIVRLQDVIYTKEHEKRVEPFIPLL